MASENPPAARHKSDFILDEGLEDDEDVLAFESKRPIHNEAHASSREQENNANGDSIAANTISSKENVNPPNPFLENQPVPLPSKAIVVDGMPADTNRSHLERFLDGCGEISSLKVYRFPDKTLAARVEFTEVDAAVSALKRHGTPFNMSSDPVTVAFAPEDWDAFIAKHPSKTTSGVVLQKHANPSRGAASIGNIPTNIAEILPNSDEIKSAFWSAIASAKHAAEILEQRARAAGTELDSRLHVQENVREVSKLSAEAAQQVDERYKVRDKLDSAVQTGKVWSTEAARGVKAVDESLGITRRISDISSSVATVSAKAAQEVDENFRVSERAREVTNSALRNERIGPIVKQAMSTLDDLRSSEHDQPRGDGPHATRKKSYPPRGVDIKSDNVATPSGEEP